MATYTLRADGTAGSLALAQQPTYGDPDIASECLSIAGYNSYSSGASPGDRFQFADTGGDYYGTILTIQRSGTSGNEIVHEAYSGDSPVMRCDLDITTETYKWTASGSGTNEYYCELSGGGNPGLVDPHGVVTDIGQIFMDDVRLSEGTAGALADHEWDWADNDTLGYSTIYIRDDTGDPDASGVVVEIPQIDNCIVASEKDYFTFDGIDCLRARERGILLTLCDYATFQNFTVSECGIVGLHFESAGWQSPAGGCHYCTVDNVTADDNWGNGLGAGGNDEPEVHSYLTIQDCTLSNNKNRDTYGSGAGLKFFGVADSTIQRNTIFANEDGGVRLDGGEQGVDGHGCDRNIVQENEIYGNGRTNSPYQHIPQINIEFSRDNIVRWNRVYDQISASFNIGIDHTRSDGNKVYGNITWGCTASFRGSICNRWVADGNFFYNNTIYVSATGVGFQVVEATNVTFKNNIIAGSPGFCIQVEDGDQTELTSDYNLFSDFKADVIRVAAGTPSTYTLAAWRTAYSQDANTIQDDAELTNPGGNDLTLSSDSPCIGAGVNLGSPFNTALLPGSIWPDGVLTGDQDNY